MPLLSIIIVNWNSQDFVRECLRSLEKHLTLDHQTVVVDGASFDGCGAMIAREFPWVEFVQSPENLGFGRCNNLGVTYATGTYLLFLNPDTEVSPGAIEALLATAEGDSRIGIVGARLLNTDGTLQTSCVQALPTPLNQTLDSDFLRRIFPHSRLWGNASAFASESATAVEAVSGACMLVHRDTFHRVGGFCPDYFMYAEDMHLCWQIAQLGKTIVYQGNSVIIHHGGGSSAGDFSKFSCLEMRRAVHHFISCRQGDFAGFLYRSGIGTSAVIRLLVLSFASVFGTQARRSQIRISTNRWLTNLRWSLRPSGSGKGNGQLA